MRRGHMVTGFAYNKVTIQDSESIRFVFGDVHDSKAVAKSLEQADCVISVLGSWGTPTKDILSAGMRNIIPTMQKNGIKRIVTLTGADARDVVDNPNLLNRFTHTLFGIIAGPVMRDGEKHIELLRKSSLNWTVIRSPIMTNGQSGKGYRLQKKLIGPWYTIPRVLVAKSLLDIVESDEFSCSAPVIVRVR